MSVVSEQPPEDSLVIGRITTVHGIKGWVKIHPYTENPQDVFSYQPWWLKTRSGWKKVEVDASRDTAKGLQCHIKGLDDRDEARNICQLDIHADKAQLPSLDQDEFYWSQLLGLTVISHFQGNKVELGTVKRLLETGANDVLVVIGNNKGAIDNQERLIPYIDQVIRDIDIDAGTIDVEWDPAF